MSAGLIIFCVIVATVFGVLMWWGRETLKDHPIRSFAVVCVAIIGGYIMWMGWQLVQIMSSPGWCAKALQAERITPGNSFAGLTACIDLLKIQLRATAVTSHIYAASLALCLLTLIVIVIAGGRLSVAASKTGLSANMSSAEDAAAAAAAQTAGAAVAEAGKIATEAAKPEISPKPVT